MLAFKSAPERDYGRYDFIPCFDRRGIATMRVPDFALDAVVFIGIKPDGKFLPRATGFYVEVPENGGWFTHIVTAEHVVSGLQTKGHRVFVRANLKDGGTVEFPVDHWHCHPRHDETRADVAVTPFARDSSGAMTSSIPLRGHGEVEPIVATAEIIKQTHIGVGDEVAIIGLFRSHHGRQRNIPIVRIGNIAAMPHEPVNTGYAGETEAYLVEARSIAGLSGSPVLVSMPPVRIVDSNIRFGGGGKQFYLLGLMHGHFDVKNLNEDVVLDDPRDATTGINTGIGVVIPVERIMETIEDQELVEERRKALKEHRAQGAVPDLALADGHLATDENPSHREDFSALLQKAAKTPPSDTSG